MESKMDKIILSHTDIQEFLRCRFRWDFGSKNRLGYRTPIVPREVDFGGAWAKAMEAFYTPDTWGKLQRNSLTVSALVKAIDKQRDNLLENSALSRSEVDEEITSRRTLGKGMLRYFFDWSAINDQHLVPISVEEEFETPILGPDGLPTYWSEPGNAQAYPVVYAGRIDKMFHDIKNDCYWLGEDKTTGTFRDAEWLAIDPQTASYMWALKRSKGMDVKGMLWTQFKTDYPKPPTVLQNGTLSVSHSKQCTSAKLFYEGVLAQHGDPPRLTEKLREKYQQYIRELEHRERLAITNEVPWLIRRVPAYVSPKISEGYDKRLYDIACDMLGDVKLYPNPNSINCQRCPFLRVCIMRQEDDDWGWVLEHQYEKVN